MMTKTGGLNLFEDWAEILVMWTFSGAILILLMFLVPFLFLFRLELSSEFLLFCFLVSFDECALAVLTRAGELGKASLFALSWGAFLLVHPHLVLVGSGIPDRCRRVVSEAQW